MTASPRGARKRAAPKRRKKPERWEDIRRKRSADPNLRLAAQAVLKTVTRIKGKIATETDPAERRRLRRLLRSTYRKMRGYREALEALAFAVPQLVSLQLVEQISTLLLVEDEFFTDAHGCAGSAGP
ncbi:MAG: hypothetical protein ACREUL_17815 [Steroidobacteraceae bacterium]